ncbi:MAG: metallophosphoesterase family protein [Byssovorax sp.]
MGRTVFVGDLHACRDELDALLQKIGFDPGDRLVMVGDLIVRGPDPAGTMEMLRSLGARSVRGNHEDRLLRWKADPQQQPLGDMSLSAALALRKRDWAYLESLPLSLDLPDHGVRVVHAGLVPGIPIEAQDPRVLMNIRCLDRHGGALEKRGNLLWGQVYLGPPHIVFGHNARDTPQIHAWATGIDTGCVYGGYLTALVLAEGQAPPPLADRQDALVSVRARKRYTDK